MEGLSTAEKAVFARKTYAVLGLAPGCGESGVKRAFKKASLLYHPDKQSGKDEAAKELAASLFIKVKEAYELLSDETQRLALDAAAEAAERATKAHSARLEQMDGTRRRMREELERREAAAAATRPSTVDDLRRKNNARTETYARERRSAAKNAAAAGSRDQAEARLDRLRRSLKVRWPSGRPVSDAELIELVRGFGNVEAVDRSDKAATVVFDTPDAATRAAVDETLASRFKDVKLCTADAWQRVHTAVADDAESRRASAGGVRRRPDEDAETRDRRRAAERADLEAAIRRDERLSPHAEPPRSTQRRLADLIQRNLDDAHDDPRLLDFAQHEFDVLSRLVARAPECR